MRRRFISAKDVEMLGKVLGNGEGKEYARAHAGKWCDKWIDKEWHVLLDAALRQSQQKQKRAPSSAEVAA